MAPYDDVCGQLEYKEREKRFSRTKEKLWTPFHFIKLQLVMVRYNLWTFSTNKQEECFKLYKMHGITPKNNNIIYLN